MLACSSRREPPGPHRGGEPPISTTTETAELDLESSPELSPFEQLREQITSRLQEIYPPLRRSDEIRQIAGQVGAQETWLRFLNILRLLAAALECDREQLVEQEERLKLRIEQVSLRKNAASIREATLSELEARLDVIEERLTLTLAWIPSIEEMLQEALEAYKHDTQRTALS